MKDKTPKQLESKENSSGARKGKCGIQVHATIPKEQHEAIKRLEGTMGVDGNGVVANIINMWLYSQDWFVDMVKVKVKENVQ